VAAPPYAFVYLDDEPADMGLYKTGAPGVPIHDQFADVAKA
jgi:hypothetical protein